MLFIYNTNPVAPVGLKHVILTQHKTVDSVVVCVLWFM